MIKSRELSDPNSCMSRAKEDEMTFVLIEREATPETIRFWYRLRVKKGKNKWSDLQILEALKAADYIEEKLQRAP